MDRERNPELSDADRTNGPLTGRKAVVAKANQAALLHRSLAGAMEELQAAMGATSMSDTRPGTPEMIAELRVQVTKVGQEVARGSLLPIIVGAMYGEGSAIWNE